MSKEEAIEILSEMRSEYNLFGDEEEATRYHVLSWAIKEMNAEPVKHGEWVDGKRMSLDGTFYWFRECSLCGYEREDDNEEKDTNFCPHCGARMDGGAE